MKKTILTRLVAAMFTLCILTSCNSSSSSSYWEAFGTISNFISTQNIELIDDSGATINITSYSTTFTSEYVGKRASVYFYTTDDYADEDDTYVEGSLYYIIFYYTQDVDYSYGIEDTQLFDLYGSSNIEITQAWFGGDYINLYCDVGYNDSTIDYREYHLVIDEETSTPTNINAKLTYRTTDLDDYDDDDNTYSTDADRYVFGYSEDVILCFKVSDIIGATDEVVTFNIYHVSDDEVETFTVDSDNTSTSSAKTISPNVNLGIGNIKL